MQGIFFVECKKRIAKLEKKSYWGKAGVMKKESEEQVHKYINTNIISAKTDLLK